MTWPRIYDVVYVCMVDWLAVDAQPSVNIAIIHDTDQYLWCSIRIIYYEIIWTILLYCNNYICVFDLICDLTYVI